MVPGACLIERPPGRLPFTLPVQATITGGTFTGLLPTGAPLTTVTDVQVETYRVFPKDSVNPPSGNVPTRVNSPSDVAFTVNDAVAGTLTYTANIIAPTFNAANSVLNGINKIPNQTTGGEGPVTGEEVQFTFTFTPAIVLPADHYFLVPQVSLSAGNFYWGGAAGTYFWVDPAEDLIVVFMTQLLGYGPELRRELKTLVYSAITESYA